MNAHLLDVNQKADALVTRRAARPPGISPEAILTDPTSSYWIKDALRAALERDPVDAANDAEILALVLDQRCTDIAATLADGGPATATGSQETPGMQHPMPEGEGRRG